MRILALIALTVVLAGCASSEFTQSSAQKYPPFEGEVELLQTRPAPGSYELLGVVMVRGVGLTSDERMYKQLRELAAERGADAVIPQGEIRNRRTTEGGEERRFAGYAIRRQ